MQNCCFTVALLFASTADAGPSWAFVDPPTTEYFRGPPATGLLKICEALEEAGRVLDALMAQKGISEDAAMQEFKRMRRDKRRGG